jgi:DNA-binding transcriptional LysR family regulator
VVRLEPAPVRRLYALWRTGAARRPSIVAAVDTLRSHWAAGPGKAAEGA